MDASEIAICRSDPAEVSTFGTYVESGIRLDAEHL